MMPQLEEPKKTTIAQPHGKLPPEVELILSAMETGEHHVSNRRAHRRHPYRVQGGLRLFSDPPFSSPWLLYTRDVHARGLGFISPHRLPLGYGGSIEFALPAGGTITVNCTLLRCREAAPGWYEGCLYFNREQPGLASAIQDASGESPVGTRYHHPHACGDL
jgi:hypothetical protein